MVSMKKQNSPKNSPAKVNKANGGAVTKPNNNAGNLSKNQLKKLKKQQNKAEAQKQDQVVKKNGAAAMKKEEPQKKGQKKDGNKKQEAKKEESSDDDDDEEDDEEEEEEDSSDDEEESEEEEVKTPTKSTKMEVEKDEEEDSDDDDEDDEEDDDDDDDDEDDDDDSEEEKEETPKEKKQKQQPKKEAKSQEAPKKAEPVANASVTKIFFAPVNVEIAAKDIIDALAKVVDKNDAALRVDVQHIQFGIPATKTECRIMMDVSKQENKEKFKQNFSFKVKNTEIQFERTKETGPRESQGPTERQFCMELRITNLPQDLPEHLNESKGAIEEAVLEAVANKFNKSDISSIFLSKDREAGAVALTSEPFYKELLALGEFDVNGTSVNVEPRSYKVFVRCNNAGFDKDTMESGIKSLLGGTNVLEFTYVDGKDPIVVAKDFYTAKKLVLDIGEHVISGQTFNFSSPFLYVKPANFGQGGGGGFRGGRGGFGGGRGGGGGGGGFRGGRGGFGGGDRRGGGGGRGFGGGRGGRGGGGGKRFSPY